MLHKTLRGALLFGFLPEKIVAFKLLRADFGDPNCIHKMTPKKNQQVRLRLGRKAWLASIILMVALCGTTAEPAMARGPALEIADAAIQRL